MLIAPAYERNPYLTEIDAQVTRIGEVAGRPYALLDDTVLYPEGGGQPSDRGFLGEIAVLDVQKAEDGIRHYLAAAVQPGPVKVRLEWARRFDHMQQHTGQHVLTAVAHEQFGWETKAFHLGDDRCDIELGTADLLQAELARLEDAVAQSIREALTVTPRTVSLDAYQSMQVRSRGLPEGHKGDVRLVEIEGLDLNTCGGTHLRSTAELECLKLLGVESIRGGTRLYFVAGGRVRHRVEAHEKRNASLRTLLGAPDEGILGALEGKLEQLRASDKRTRQLEEELTALVVEALALRTEALLERHFEGRDAGFLQKTARQLLASAPGKMVFLTSSVENAHFFVLAAGEGTPWDVTAIGKEIAVLLAAKGGGAKGFFQGKADSLVRREEALGRLRAGS